MVCHLKLDYYTYETLNNMIYLLIHILFPGLFLTGLQKLTQISSKVSDAGNVHSGVPPPWFDATNGIHFDPVVKTVKSKLNPNRVGAAWAEKRKLEMEMEIKGELPVNTFDANWLPNFGRVWQSGTRNDCRKEFEVEAKKTLMDEIQSDSYSSLQLQRYISNRMRREDKWMMYSLQQEKSSANSVKAYVIMVSLCFFHTTTGAYGL